MTLKKSKNSYGVIVLIGEDFDLSKYEQIVAAYPHLTHRYATADYRTLLRVYRSAKSRHISFELTVDDIRAHLPGLCVYCGGKATGLDRVDSKRGYCQENIVPACRRCNIMKTNMALDDFIEHIQTILKHMALEIL
jgi:5-methylcytosine-specific restriction endonuclease McrA